VNAIQKPLSGLKNVLQTPHEAFQELAVTDLPSLTKILMLKRCLILPSISDKTDHEVEKGFL
jgi:hypothetical protein